MINPFRSPSFLPACCAAIWLSGSAVLNPAYAKQPADAASGPAAFHVLFIGNSHLFVNDVPFRVQRHLQSTNGPIRIRTFARGGAQLSSFTRRGDIEAALKSRAWDTVVLQEASATFLSPSGGQRFERAVDWFVRRLPATTRVVLYQTWPWRAGSRYFDGRSADAAGMWRAMRSAYDKIARHDRVIIAPVGTCWVRSPKRNAFYSADGNHASVAGSRYAAAVIARTIRQGRSSDC